MSKKLSFALFIILALVSVGFVFLVLFTDVQMNGDTCTNVGLAGLNFAFRDFIGYHDLFYEITNVLGYSWFVVAFAFACVGLFQLISRKGILRIDKHILATAGLYVVAAVIYAIFEVVVVNYRPLLIEGELDPSFPSSHTFFSLVVLIGACMEIGNLIKSETVRNIIRWILYVLCFVIVVLRIISGYHWITDIIGAILFAATLLSAYSMFVSCEPKRDEYDD